MSDAALLTGKGTMVELEVGSEFLLMPGVQSRGMTQDAATSETVEYFPNQTNTETGVQPQPAIQIGGLSVPFHPTFDDLEKKRSNGESGRIRISQPPLRTVSVTGTGNTVAIASDGTVTTAGANRAPITRLGSVIEVGGSFWVVKAISGGVARVSPLGSAAATLNATENYKVKNPGYIQGPVGFSVISFNQWNVDGFGNYTFEANLQVQGVIPPLTPQ